MEVIVSPGKIALTGPSLEQVETRGAGKFFVLQLNRRGGDRITSPDRARKVEAGDGVVVVSRIGGAIARAMFEAPAERIRAGRTTF